MEQHAIELQRWQVRLENKSRRAYFFDLLADEHGLEVAGRAMRGQATAVVDDMVEVTYAALDEDRLIPEIDPDAPGVAEWVPNVGLVGYWSPGRPGLGLFYTESLCETAKSGYVIGEWMPARCRRLDAAADGGRIRPTARPAPWRAPTERSKIEAAIHPVLLAFGALVGFAFSMAIIAVALAISSGRLTLDDFFPAPTSPPVRLVGPTAYA